MYQKAPTPNEAQPVPIEEVPAHYFDFDYVPGAKHSLKPVGLRRPDQPRFHMTSGGGANTIDANPDDIDAECVRCFTPRSKEAMKETGVTPKDIIDRPLSSFAEKGLPRHVQQLRCDVFRMNRAEAINIVSKKRRENIFASKENAERDARRAAREKQQFEARLPNERVLQSADLIEQKEAERLAKMRNRRKREIENLVTNEVIEHQKREKHEERVKYNDKIRARGVELMEKAKAVNEVNLQLKPSREQVVKGNLARKERSAKVQAFNQTARLSNAKKAAKKSAENHMFAQTMNGRKNQFELNEMRELNEDRKRRVEIRNKRFVEKQLQAFEQRSMELEFREMEREKSIARKNAEKIAKNAEKTQKAKERVEKAFHESERRIIENRKHMEMKMANDDARLALFHEKMAQKRAEKLKKKAQQEAKRQQNVVDAKRAYHQKMKSIIKKQEQHEQQWVQREQQELEKAEFMRELARLNKVRKMHNVERIKRKNEYEREQLIRKVNDDARRAKEFEEAKQNVLLKRQQAQIAVDRQKREMIYLFEDVTKTGDWKKLSSMGYNYDEIMKKLGESQVQKKCPPSATQQHFNYNPKQYSSQLHI